MCVNTLQICKTLNSGLCAPIRQNALHGLFPQALTSDGGSDPAVSGLPRKRKRAVRGVRLTDGTDLREEPADAAVLVQLFLVPAVFWWGGYGLG